MSDIQPIAIIHDNTVTQERIEQYLREYWSTEDIDLPFGLLSDDAKSIADHLDAFALYALEDSNYDKPTLYHLLATEIHEAFKSIDHPDDDSRILHLDTSSEMAPDGPTYLLFIAGYASEDAMKLADLYRRIYAQYKSLPSPEFI